MGILIRTSCYLGVWLLSTISLWGAVRFEFYYMDEAGTGFHVRPEAKQALESIAQDIGSWLDHNATIKVAVHSFEDTGSQILASAHSRDREDYRKKGFHHTPVAKKILLGKRGKLGEPDMDIEVNFSASYAFGDSVGKREIDFKSLMLHEITHALGMASRLGEDAHGSGSVASKGAGANGRAANPNKSYDFFDQFIVDIHGRPLVREDLTLAYSLSSSSKRMPLFFVGPHVQKLCGRVPLERREQLCHIDQQGMFSNALMKAVNRFGKGHRTWSAFETAILQDIGYTIVNTHTRAAESS